jgi:PleD family two-component response regulator
MSSVATNAEGSAVLVIDDSDIDRETMASILTEAGFKVHTQPSPIGATKTARDLGVRVVVIDQNLPAMDGTKLAALFLGNAALRSVRVVLVSGNEDDEMFELAKQAQVDAFVCKRDLHLELVNTVTRLLGAP